MTLLFIYCEFDLCALNLLLIAIILDDLEHAMTDVSIRFSQVLADVRSMLSYLHHFSAEVLVCARISVDLVN